MRCFHLKAWYDLAKNILFFVFLFFYLKAWCNLGIPVKIHTVLVFQIGLKIFSLSKTTIFDVSVSPYRMSEFLFVFFLIIVAKNVPCNLQSVFFFWKTTWMGKIAFHSDVCGQMRHFSCDDVRHARIEDGLKWMRVVMTSCDVKNRVNIAALAWFRVRFCDRRILEGLFKEANRTVSVSCKVYSHWYWIFANWISLYSL